MGSRSGHRKLTKPIIIDSQPETKFDYYKFDPSMYVPVKRQEERQTVKKMAEPRLLKHV